VAGDARTQAAQASDPSPAGSSKQFFCRPGHPGTLKPALSKPALLKARGVATPQYLNFMVDPSASAAPAPELTVSARELSRSFGAIRAVHGLDLALKRGEVLGLLGPNGAGKTTAMQMLTGNLAPSAGEVDICGIDLIDRPTQAKSRIGYLP